jgi:hypothetical protein
MSVCEVVFTATAFVQTAAPQALEAERITLLGAPDARGLQRRRVELYVASDGGLESRFVSPLSRPELRLLDHNGSQIVRLGYLKSWSSDR